MFIELHMLQNFAPSCLNRDDTNSPKDCEFGGFRRARISSQCIKRAIRTFFGSDATPEGHRLSDANRAERTKRLVEEVVRKLAENDKDEEISAKVVKIALASGGLTVKDDGKTQYLLFLGRNEINALAALCLEHWDTLAELASKAESEGGKKDKKKAKADVPDDIKKALAKLLDGGKAADLALFGRMLADLPQHNIDAACQVAHAISTNKVSMEFDFYTAVDDLNPEDTAGAGMMGTVEFNSACFYRYANIDINQLKDNLGDDEELARKTIEAFIYAAINAIPTGKQNSMAAQNPPEFIAAVVRDNGLWSLANAFVKPVQPNPAENLIELSAENLKTYWTKLCDVYGDDGIKGEWAVSLVDGKTTPFTPAGKVKELIENVSKELQF